MINIDKFRYGIKVALAFALSVVFVMNARFTCIDATLNNTNKNTVEVKAAVKKITNKNSKKELKKRGYKVYMVRNSQNVNISNKERAIKANESGAAISICIHADGSTSTSLSGASALYPGSTNPFVKRLSAKSKILADCIISKYCKETGFVNRGAVVRNDLTGVNWSTIPVMYLEMGFMTNYPEDRKMQQDKYQAKMVNGIADGIDSYFKKVKSSKSKQKKSK